MNYLFLVITILVFRQSNQELINLRGVQDFNEFLTKSEDNLSLIYLSFQDDDASKLKLYDTNSNLLEKYGIQFAQFVCDGLGDHLPQCEDTNGKGVVSAYRSQEFLINLELEHMFDVISIESNVLQVLLIKVVPIHTTIEERVNWLNNRGLIPNIYGYFPEIGIKSHRNFMELAYKHKDSYKFGFSVELSACEGLHLSENLNIEESTFWLIKCSQDGECNSYRYIIDDFPDSTILNMITTFGETNVFDRNEIDILNDFANLRNKFSYFGLVCYSRSDADYAIQIIDDISYAFKGIIGFFLIEEGVHDMSSSECLEMKDGGTIFVYGNNGESMSKISDIQLHGNSKMYLADEIWRSISVEKHIFTNSEYESTQPSPTYGVLDQDDKIAALAQRLNANINMKELILTDKTHQKFITSPDYRMVLYYLPYDPVSKVFLVSFKDAVKDLLNSNLNVLAIMNCFDYTYVCQEQNITTYPTIKVFKRDISAMIYDRSLSTREIITTMKMLYFKIPIYLENNEDVKAFVSGQLPYQNMHSVSNFTILAVFNEFDENKLISFKDLLPEKIGIPLGYTVNLDLNFLNIDIDILPESSYAIIYHRVFDQVETKIISIPNYSDLNALIHQNTITSFPKLSVNNFPHLFSLKRPFIILFDDDIGYSSPAYLLMSSISSLHEFSQRYIFAYMDTHNPDGIEKKILEKYLLEDKLPVINCIDHSTGNVITFPQNFEKNPENIVQWLININSEEPTQVLNSYNWTPLSHGYDFLKMIDDKLEHRSEEYNGEDFDFDGASFQFSNNAENIFPNMHTHKGSPANDRGLYHEEL